MSTVQKKQLRRIKPVFHLNRVVAKVEYSIVFMSLVLSECSRNNEIRYVSLRYGWSGKRALRLRILCENW